MSIKGKEHRDQKLAEIALPELDCACMDKRTRKILLYLIGKETKYLSKFPRAMVDGAEYDIMVLKAQVEACALPKSKARGPKKEKIKRAPSHYNQFMKECASSVEKGGAGLKFSECAAMWTEQKAAK